MALSLLTQLVEADELSERLLAGDFRSLIGQVGSALMETGVARVAPVSDAGAMIVGGLIHAGAATLCRWRPDLSEDVVLIDGVAASPLAIDLAHRRWGAGARCGILIQAPSYAATPTNIPVVALEARTELRAAG